MSGQWPSEPGPHPPVESGGRPPLEGDWPQVGSTDATPTPARAPLPPKRVLLLAAVVAFAALAGGAIAFLLIGGTGEEDDTTSAATTTTERPTTTTAPDPAAEDDPTVEDDPGGGLTSEELQVELDRLSAFVEERRGLGFLEPVTGAVLDDERFEARLLEDFEESEEDLVLLGRLLEAIGTVPPGTDLPAAVRQLLGQGAAGFYDMDTGEVVVRGDELTPLVRQILVHELVHALDDQHFDLDRPEHDERDDEVPATFHSVLEGNARRIEQDWIATLSEREQEERRLEEARLGVTLDLTGVPPVLFDLLLAPYVEGEHFVRALVAAGGEDAVNEALRHPPETTSQILHPEKYFAGVERVEVDPPPAEGEVLDEGAFGERMLRIMLGTRLDRRRAAEAAEGWAGDWYVAWETPEGGTCVRVDIAMEHPDDMQTLATALERYAFDLPDAEVRDLDDDTVRFTSCTDHEDDAAADGSVL